MTHLPSPARAARSCLVGQSLAKLRSQANAGCAHFSHSRPMAMPGSLRHMMRSGWCFAMAAARYKARVRSVRSAGAQRRAEGDDEATFRAFHL
jgi:hypothetical protein